MAEETRKRDGDGDNDSNLDIPTSVKRLKNDCTESIGDLDDDIMAELMKFLDSDDGASSQVKFIEYPYSSSLIFQSSCSYITINGYEESCGSSYSDRECSVMASVDMCGVMSNVGKATGSDEFCDWFQGAWMFEEARGVDGGGVEWGSMVGVESEGSLTIF
ncbi:hypothetical protein M5689_023472 [Euphorbia peplus]|nr:hypothetical protein M5689_023472 [Euphorbia peplus]